MPNLVDSPEAQIPVFNPLQKSNIPPPAQLIIAIANAAATTLYDRSVEPDIDKIIVQNLANTPVRYCINDACTQVYFHGVLAGGSAQDDGLGTVATWTWQDGVRKLTVFHEANPIRLQITKYYRQGSLPTSR